MFLRSRVCLFVCEYACVLACVRRVCECLWVSTCLRASVYACGSVLKYVRTFMFAYMCKRECA